jgi:hypothetical protein
VYKSFICLDWLPRKQLQGKDRLAVWGMELQAPSRAKDFCWIKQKLVIGWACANQSAIGVLHNVNLNFLFFNFFSLLLCWGIVAFTKVLALYQIYHT